MRLLENQQNTEVPGNVALSTDQLSVTFKPDQTLKVLTEYKVQVQGVRDIAGNLMAELFESKFSTDESVDNINPVVVQSNPFDRQTDVPVNTPFTVEFSKLMNPATIVPGNFTVRDTVISQNITGDIQVDPDGRTVSFVPEQPFAVGRLHTVSLSSNITDAASNRLSGLRSYRFTTAFDEDNVAPVLVTTSPTDGQLNVPINSNVMLNFNEPLNVLNYQGGIKVLIGQEQVNGSMSIFDGNRSVTFVPDNLLLSGTTYNVVTTADITDLAGNVLGNPRSYSFKTGDLEDFGRPFVSSVEPANLERRVPRNVVVQVDFNEQINPVSITSSTFRLLNNNTSIQVPGKISLSNDGLSATFTPDQLLDKSTTYLVNLSSILDFAGNNLSFSSRFTTAQDDDIGAPFITNVSPQDFSNNVSVNTKIVLEISEPVRKISVDNSDVNVMGVGGTVTGFLDVSNDRRELTFRPSGLLLGNSLYTIEITGFTDLAGNDVAPFMSSFTTKGSGGFDSQSPSVDSIIPADGSFGIPVDTKIVWTFNESINPLTVNNDSIKVKINGLFSPVAGDYTVDESTVTFTPAVPLPGGVLVETEVNGQVKDLAGNSSGFFSSTFFTDAIFDSTSPEVVKITPGDGTEDVGPNAEVVLTFSESLSEFTISNNNFSLFANGESLSTNVERSSDNRTVTLSSTLPSASLVTVIVTGDVMDLSGNQMLDFQSGFSTSDFNSNQPSVVSQRPGSGASGVAVDTSIVLYVNESLDESTMPGALHISQNGKVVNVSSNVKDNGHTIEVVPDIPFENNAFIEVFLDSNARAFSGNTLNNYQGQFRTLAEDPTTIAPFVVSTNPVLNATGVPINTIIDIEFNEALDIVTVGSDTVKLKQNIFKRAFPDCSKII